MVQTGRTEANTRHRSSYWGYGIASTQRASSAGHVIERKCLLMGGLSRTQAHCMVGHLNPSLRTVRVMYMSNAVRNRQHLLVDVLGTKVQQHGAAPQRLQGAAAGHPHTAGRRNPSAICGL